MKTMFINWRLRLGFLVFLTYVTQWASCFNCERCRDADVCETVAGTLRYTVMSKGYNPVVVIPRGSCYINVTEAGHTDNVLALKSARGYVFNGFWKMDPAGDYNAAGTKFSYRKSEGACPGECIFASGPTLAKLTVQLLYHERNPGVHYTYKVARHLQDAETDTRPGSEHGELRETPIGYKEIPETEDEDRIGQGQGHTGSSQTGIFPEMVPLPGLGGIRHRGPIFSSDFAHRRRISGADNLLNSDSRRNRGRRPGPAELTLAGSNRRQALTDVTYSRGVDDDTIERSRNSIGGPNDVIKVTSARNGIVLEDSGNGNELEGSGDDLVSVLHAYIWWMTDYTECSRPCGGGMQESVHSCLDLYTRLPVSAANCRDTLKPATRHRVCNPEPCTPIWMEGDWSACSVTCGQGQQSRDVTCQQRLSATDYQHIADSYCTSAKPTRTRVCHRAMCYNWVTKGVGNCSVQCGLGVRKKKVRCEDEAGLIVNDSFCNQSTPVLEESCDMGSCNSRWFYGQWSEKCSDACEGGEVSREVFCLAETGQVLQDRYCDQHDKPNDRKRCGQQMTSCVGQWFTGSWSKCSPSCGEGIKTRPVFCMKPSQTDGYTLMADTECQDGDKPRTTKNCTTSACGPTWYRTEWSKCSKTCGGGVQTRAVKCMAKHQNYSTTCSEKDQPIETQACNVEKCRTSRDRTGDTDCTDQYPNCRVVVEANLCRYPYYQRKCCRSCTGKKLGKN